MGWLQPDPRWEDAGTQADDQPDRPDLPDLDAPAQRVEEPDWMASFFPQLACTACPCCDAASLPDRPSDGDACAVCGWVWDETAQADGTPSASNDHLCLQEAQMNFRTFGVITPWRSQTL